MGEVAGREDVLCRIRSACVGGHVFNSVECTCADKMAAAQKAVQEAGRGVIVYLDHEGKGNGRPALLAGIPYKKAGLSQSKAYVKAVFKADARDYRPAAEILQDLGVGSVVLLTENAKKADELRGHSVSVAGTRGLNSADDRPPSITKR